MKKINILLCYTALFMQGCIFTPPASELARWQRYKQVHFDENNPVLTVAKAQLGTEYRYGGMSPFGFDCSGFVAYVYDKSVHKKLPRTALAQSQYAQKISKNRLRGGDLVFFDTSNRGHVNHCGIYIGEGNFIHASSGKVYAVTISNLNAGFYKKVYRGAGRVAY